ncbi:MAG: hypothetical protein M0T85_05145 [Dehalococcoidales bacterium]|nr:hypothetical protein [Dehalococcoidales bacterium]
MARLGPEEGDNPPIRDGSPAIIGRYLRGETGGRPEHRQAMKHPRGDADYFFLLAGLLVLFLCC